VSDPKELSLDNCGCCEQDPAPQAIYNRPGLPALSYRAGSYGTFFRRMLRQLGTYTLQDGDFAGARPLAALTTREQDDPSVALLDASAVVADVLTFYQERIANEGFLRTATERRSILEMARAIGYELNPGVAASVYLAFTVEDAKGAPGVAEVPAGTKVQSIPPPGKLPQSFETSDALTACKEWNAVRPRLGQPQAVQTTSQTIYLSGGGSGLRVGDLLLLVTGTGSGGQALARVHRVEVDSDAGTTRIDLAPTSASVFPAAHSTTPGEVGEDKVVFGEDQVVDWILAKSWTDRDLGVFLSYNGWDRGQLLDTLANIRARNLESTGEVHVLRASAGFFGNNAPRYASLPTGTGATYGTTWDSGWEIWKDHASGGYYDSAADVYLEHPLAGLLPETWVVLAIPDGTKKFTKLAATVEKSVTGFAISGKSTGLKLTAADGTALSNDGTGKPATFQVRNTVAYLQSEQLPLAELPIASDLAASTDTLELDGLVLGLKIGQAVTLSGDRTDAPGVTGSEILVIKDITHAAGFTTLVFETGCQFSYSRNAVTVNANTVRATHGETVNEILGSGNGALAGQTFTLKKPPLTHVPAGTPGGSESTLQLRVNNLLWEQAPSLYGLGSWDEGYIVRIDDDGKAAVIFGDGLKGARLPTGTNNVTAVYRSGIGLDGQVDAGSLSLLQSKPFGIRSVVNPLAAGGAADPEKMEDARSNAPLTVRTLDRVVSREDYEDFAAAFAGVGKAQAVDLWSGESHLVHVTLGGADGQPITDAEFIANFIDALAAVRDPAQLVRVDTFDLLLFDLVANVSVDSRYVKDDVFAAIETALAEAFAFERRAFGQSVTAAEVITVIQDVEGVVYVDLDKLYLAGDGEVLNQVLPSAIAHATGTSIQRARLLLLNELGVTLQEVQA
jgi:hypothetical protein